MASSLLSREHPADSNRNADDRMGQAAQQCRLRRNETAEAVAKEMLLNRGTGRNSLHDDAPIRYPDIRYVVPL